MTKGHRPNQAVVFRTREKPRGANTPDENEGSKFSSSVIQGLASEIFDISAKDVVSGLNKVSLGDLVDMLKASGLRSHPALTKFAEFRMGLLEPFGITPDYLRLEKLGVRKESIAIALMAINIAPGFDQMSREFGNRRSRERQVKSLLAPITVLTKFEGMMGDAIKKFPPTTLASPELLISNLRHYSSMLTWAEKSQEVFGSNSFLELAKFAFAGLVKRVTNRYHDREVSALTGAALQIAEYDETAHRIWRIRNYSRLEGTCAVAPLVFQAFNSVILEK